MPEPLLRFRQLLLIREGGNKVMAQVLATVPSAGLEAVLVAVGLMLESGAVSVEHVLNMLSRLRPGPVTEPVHTRLRIHRAPIADTQRYDRLHSVEQNREASHA